MLLAVDTTSKVKHVIAFGDARLPARFWAKVKPVNWRWVTGSGLIASKRNTCWFWTGAKTGKGYGSFYLGKDKHGRQRTGVTHKLTYELAFGRIEEARKDGFRLVVDHRCRHRACCNPDHLELVTEPINVSRGESPSAQHARKTHCPRGHEYTEANTYKYRVRTKVNGRVRDTTKRYCRACRRKDT